jgi:hypothetical protein
MPQAQARRIRREAERFGRGVYLPSGAARADLANRVRAALLAAPEGSMATGLTTLALAGVEMPARAEIDVARRVHILVPGRDKRGPRRDGIAVHRRKPHCPGLIHQATGLPTASLVDSWIDAARLAGIDYRWTPWADQPARAIGYFDSAAKRILLETVQLGDALLRRHQPWATPAQLAECVASEPSSPGVRLVRHAFALVRAGTDSLTETQLRLILWDAGLPEPVCNHELVLDGRHLFLDLAWPEPKVALEYHGRQHFDRRAQAEEDLSRRIRLQSAGWLLVEAVYRDLVQPRDVLARVTAALGR